MKKIFILIPLFFIGCSSDFRSLSKDQKKERVVDNLKHLGGNILGVTVVVSYAKVMGVISDSCKSCQ